MFNSAGRYPSATHLPGSAYPLQGALVGLPTCRNALDYVNFARACTAVQKNSAIAGLVDLLHELSADFRVDVTLDGRFSATGSKILELHERRSRCAFVSCRWRRPLSPTRVIVRIEGKFGKHYATTGRLELLAFYELHPTYRAECEAADCRSVCRGRNLQSNAGLRECRSSMHKTVSFCTRPEMLMRSLVP